MFLWIIYFWLIALLVGLSAIGRVYLFFTSEIVTGYDLVESLISLTAIVGLYGFVYKRQTASPLFWKIVWTLLLLTWIVSFFAAKNAEMIEKFGLAKSAVIIILIAALAVPTLVALYLYSFRSTAL